MQLMTRQLIALALAVVGLLTILTGIGRLWARAADALTPGQIDRRRRITARGYRLLAIGVAGIVGALLLTACATDHNSLTGPDSPPIITGTWSGIVSAFGSPAGPGGIQATLAQTGSTVTGTWGTSYPNPAYNAGGALTGSTSGSTLTLTLTPGSPTLCPYVVTGVLVNATTIQGTFATISCSVVQSGTFNLGKQ